MHLMRRELVVPTIVLGVNAAATIGIATSYRRDESLWVLLAIWGLPLAQASLLAMWGVWSPWPWESGSWC